MGFQVRGADELRSLAADLKAKGGNKLVRAFAKDLRKEAQPIVAQQRSKVKSLSGAPSEWRSASASKVRVKTSFSARSAGVRITSGGGETGKRSKSLNTGRWRHPVWGRGPWQTQTVPPDWFDDPPQRARIRLHGSMQNVLRRYLQSIGK